MSSEGQSVGGVRARVPVEKPRLGPLRVVLSAGVFLLGVLAGRWSIDKSSAPRTPEQGVHAPEIALPGPAYAQKGSARATEHNFLVRPVELFVPKDQEAEQRYRKEQSRDLVDLLRAMVARSEAAANPAWGPEAAANNTALYVNGWLDGVMRTAPDLVDELAGEIEQTMCDSHSSAPQLIVMSRVVTMMPELANPKAFDCIFSKHQEEDLVLWSALDAWRRSGLPKTEAITRIEQTAKDSRTLQRLLSLEEQRTQRAAASANLREQDTPTPSSPSSPDKAR